MYIPGREQATETSAVAAGRSGKGPSPRSRVRHFATCPAARSPAEIAGVGRHVDAAGPCFGDVAQQAFVHPGSDDLAGMFEHGAVDDDGAFMQGIADTERVHGNAGRAGIVNAVQPFLIVGRVVAVGKQQDGTRPRGFRVEGMNGQGKPGGEPGFPIYPRHWPESLWEDHLPRCFSGPGGNGPDRASAEKPGWAGPRRRPGRADCRRVS